MKNNIENSMNLEEENLNLKNEFSYYLFFWPWFLLTLIISLTGAYIYLRYTPNIYNSSAQIQITKPDASSSFLTTEITSLFGTRINVQNDISVLTSHHILKNVVKRLNLQTSITEVGRVQSNLKFANEVPFQIIFKDLSKFQTWNFKISNDYGLISNGFKSFKINKNEILENKFFTLTLNDSLKINNKEFNIVSRSLDNSTTILKNRIKAIPASKNGEIINLSISGTNKKRNDAVLNTLINVLMEDRIKDQQQLSEASIKFIDKRLTILKKNIDSISKETIKYQLENNIYNSAEQTSNALNKMVKENEVSFNLKIQLQIANSLLEYLKNQQNFDILPVNIGVEDAGINELLLSFNTLVMDRNNLLVSATKESPIVSQINEKLKNLKNASLKGINRYIKNLQVSLSNYQKTNNESLEYISTFPQKEYILRTLAREFKFAEDLLVFLSQRKEEASISFVSC